MDSAVSTKEDQTTVKGHKTGLIYCRHRASLLHETNYGFKILSNGKDVCFGV